MNKSLEYIIAIGVVVLMIIISVVKFVFDFNLPLLKFGNDEYDVNEVTFIPRNLLKDKIENDKKDKEC